MSHYKLTRLEALTRAEALPHQPLMDHVDYDELACKSERFSCQ